MAPSRAGQSWHRALPVCPLPRATCPQIQAFSSFPPPKLEILILSPFSLVQQSKKKPQRMSPTRGRRRLLTRESLGSLTHRSATRSLESNSDPKVFFFVYFSFFVCVFLFLKCLSSTGTPPPQEFVPPAKPSVGAGRQRSARQLDLKYPQYPNIQTSTFTPRVQKSQEGMEEKQGLGWGSWGGAPNLPKTPKLGHKTDASPRGCPSVGLVFGGAPSHRTSWLLFGKSQLQTRREKVFFLIFFILTDEGTPIF